MGRPALAPRMGAVSASRSALWAGQYPGGHRSQLDSKSASQRVQRGSKSASQRVAPTGKNGIYKLEYQITIFKTLFDVNLIEKNS